MALLTDEERQTVTELLTRQVAGNPAPRATLAVLLHVSLQDQLDVNGQPWVLAEKTIDICIRSDYDLKPPALYKVLEFLIEKTNSPELGPLLDRLNRPPPTKAVATQARILGSRLPFADREGFRTILREMFTIAEADPILLVRGDTQSGKSYVAELVEHVCVRSNDSIFCKFAIKSESEGRDATPLAVASDLVTQLGGDPRGYPPQTANVDAWLPELANWVIANANAASKGSARVWLVIDGLRQGFVLPETGRFLAKLARQCALGVAARRHRLLLSDFSEEHTGMLPTRVKRYNTEPITLADVQAVVTEIIQASTRFPPADKPELVKEALATVLQGLSPPLSSMATLGQRLEALIARAEL